ncbi:hypothetical protein BDP55DRAFT_766282 [Colletotrichum godetiae]|uniref:FAD-binding domain-containing protein n=1 Tax=Colletotrichum godetiae TaxID=1209918 RepID=A0AAJ0ATV9_9PEZI|nr:uncharacterized protein BDP55DRAFT_766282 [Colletotrichum godetiae]KAK1688876.1 hypothetical protein BDP55DRAFT_766282 [Colletotrichum godetiae]
MGLKIAIVGGSIAGLTLANMLEKFDGLDYTLLEAYPSIAPQVGASIGLLPNGLRILEQLGCYQRIRELAEDCNHRMNCREVGGRLLYCSGLVTISERLEEETGYPCNVLPNKCVIDVETTESGVAAHTRDAATYTGDILVGADGVHSIIREEMWCTSHHTAFSRGRGYVAISAPRNRVYWLMFVALGKTYHGSADIPRFSKLDEAALVAALVFLEEHVFSKWHCGRIVLVGDSAHKVHPITAQGGNGALESNQQHTYSTP